MVAQPATMAFRTTSLPCAWQATLTPRASASSTMAVSSLDAVDEHLRVRAVRPRGGASGAGLDPAGAPVHVHLDHLADRFDSLHLVVEVLVEPRIGERRLAEVREHVDPGGEDLRAGRGGLSRPCRSSARRGSSPPRRSSSSSLPTRGRGRDRRGCARASGHRTDRASGAGRPGRARELPREADQCPPTRSGRPGPPRRRPRARRRPPRSPRGC